MAVPVSGRILALLTLFILTAWAPTALADIPGIPAFTVTPGEEEGVQEYSVSLQILALMTALTFLPAMLMMMTSFTRIIVVFAILRQALGLQSTPSNQILLGLTLFLTIFIMKPVLEEVNEVALQPYMQEELSSLEAVEQASQPFRKFMLAQTGKVTWACSCVSPTKNTTPLKTFPFGCCCRPS